eukprot:1177436-Prorocentrum_minimum.AAC.3
MAAGFPSNPSCPSGRPDHPPPRWSRGPRRRPSRRCGARTTSRAPPPAPQPPPPPPLGLSKSATWTDNGTPFAGHFEAGRRRTRRVTQLGRGGHEGGA